MTQALQDFRQSIDYLDMSCMYIIAERVRVLTKTGIIKKQQDLPATYSPQREKDLHRTIAIAMERGINELFIKRIFNRMYQEALQLRENPSTCCHSKFLNEQPIQDLQTSIYNLDIALCHLLAERFHVVKKVGVLKKEAHLEALSPKRWEEVLNSKLEIAAKLNIDINFTKDILNIIHEESLRIETTIITDE